jgi:hypothetical protein
MAARPMAAMMTMAMNPASLPIQDGEDDIADEAGADGNGSVGQEPSSDAHELQGLLQAFENWIAVECHIYK